MPAQSGGHFTPIHSERNVDFYGGISIKNIPKEIDRDVIVELLIKCGLPSELHESVVIKESGLIFINNINNDLCKCLIKKIHLSKQFGRKLICRGVIPMTPDAKNGSISAPNTPVSVTSDQHVLSPAESSYGDQQIASDILENKEGDNSLSVPVLSRRKSVRDLVTDFSSCMSNISSSEEENGDWTLTEDNRRKCKRKKGKNSPPQEMVKKVMTQSTT